MEAAMSNKIQKTKIERDVSKYNTPDGYIELMTKPGLGIEVDEKAVREASVKGHRGRAPEWRHKDGSFAEW